MIIIQKYINYRIYKFITKNFNNLLVVKINFYTYKKFIIKIIIYNI